MLEKFQVSGDLPDLQTSARVVRLCIAGKNELFGIEEIIENAKFRMKTVKCMSSKGSTYFISQENFIDCVNQYKFSDHILYEQIIKHKFYTDRIQETQVFQDKFNKHMKLHFLTPETGHACKYCGKLWLNKSEKEKHERTHASEKPFKV